MRNTVARVAAGAEIVWVAATAKPVVTVTVRELVEFTLRTGDLGGGGDFVGSNRALAGTLGHQRVQRSRPEGYEKEVRLSYDVDGGDFALRVQGRIDGLLASAEGVLLEEIKTTQGAWDGTADPLHWAQAKVYGYIYAREHALASLRIRLTYLNLDTGKLTEFSDDFSFERLRDFFESATAPYLEWMREYRSWVRERDNSLRELAFPFVQYRPGQRKLAVAAYKTLARGGRLFLEAPTGIGKTVAVMLPALKALGEGKLERVFYLTARTIGRSVAEKTLTDLRGAGLRARTLTLTAKEKICFQQGQVCDPAACPFARGYYDRQKAAMREALAREELTRPVVEEIARRHELCPFELSLDVSSWVDVVICDYNYAFDPQAYLRRHFGEEGGDYAFLVDEAHNLVDRAREMFSADLETREIREVRRAVKERLPRCARALSQLNSALKKLAGPADRPTADADADPLSELDLFRALPGAVEPPEAKPRPPANGGVVEGVVARRDLPAEVLERVEAALEQAEAWLARNEPADFREALLGLYFRLFTFRRTADGYDERYVTLSEAGREARVRLFCVDPSFLLRQALERGKAAIFFSATLTPSEYYLDLLGGSPEDPVLRLSSPFPPEHLEVVVQDRIRTNYKARAGTLGEVAETIGAVIGARRGNYLVYFPSYQYLNAVLEQFQTRHPRIRSLVQRPGMGESEREEFLAAFAHDQEDTLVGFAVMGGIFGEGIDLVGERLIGAIIVGVGLPQLCAERDLIRDYFQAKTGGGFDYAYTFPGMNRVLQATGRVIRSETDHGVVVLIDTRFGEPRYRRLFPSWWKAERAGTAAEIRRRVREFWGVES